MWAQQGPFDGKVSYGILNWESYRQEQLDFREGEIQNKPVYGYRRLWKPSSSQDLSLPWVGIEVLCPNPSSTGQCTLNVQAFCWLLRRARKLTSIKSLIFFLYFEIESIFKPWSEILVSSVFFCINYGKSPTVHSEAHFDGRAGSIQFI